MSRSESCAARTVLAAGGGCCPVDRHASRWVCRWAGTAAPSWCGARLLLEPGRWSARSGPLSAAGSGRPSPDGQTEATSPDRGRRGMMPGDRFGSLLLQGFTPVLLAPLAGVGGIHPDHRDAAVGAMRSAGRNIAVGILAMVGRSLSAFPRPRASRPMARASAKSSSRSRSPSTVCSLAAPDPCRARPARLDATPAVTTYLAGFADGFPSVASRTSRCPSCCPHLGRLRLAATDVTDRGPSSTEKSTATSGPAPGGS